MKVLFCGTGSAINTDSIGSSVLLNGTILIDAPGGINAQLFRSGVDVDGLKSILITHAHGDHIFGLPFVLLEYMIRPRSEPLTIVGPDNLNEKIRELTRLAFPEADPERLLSPAKSEYIIIHDGEVVTLAGTRIRVFRVPHGPVETYGFHITESGGKSLLYVPDVERGDKIKALVEEADIAMLDSTTPVDAIPAHMSLRDVADMASTYPEKKFFAIHRGRYQIDASQLPDNLIIPNTGDSFDWD
jgi:ribonuclease BN (tRNA processing enzyme)